MQRISVTKCWSTAICKWSAKNSLVNLTPWLSRKDRRYAICSTTPFCVCSTSDVWRRSRNVGGPIIRRNKNAATLTINPTAFPFKTLVSFAYLLEKKESFKKWFLFENSGGVFIVIFVGIFLACVTLAIEYCYFKFKRQPDSDEMVTRTNSNQSDRINRMVKLLWCSTVHLSSFDFNSGCHFRRRKFTAGIWSSRTSWIETIKLKINTPENLAITAPKEKPNSSRILFYLFYTLNMILFSIFFGAGEMDLAHVKPGKL